MPESWDNEPCFEITKTSVPAGSGSYVGVFEMASVNKAILVGNLGADPEIRYTPAGTPTALVRVATTDKWKDKTTGEPKESTEWHRVVFFNRLAEIVSENLKKVPRFTLRVKLRQESGLIIIVLTVTAPRLLAVNCKCWARKMLIVSQAHQQLMSHPSMIILMMIEWFFCLCPACPGMSRITIYSYLMLSRD